MATPARTTPRLAFAALAAAALVAGCAAAPPAAEPEPEAALAPRVLVAYDLDLAMTLAGDQVPPYVEEFYFFVLDVDAAGETVELADTLVRAAREHDFLGIAGPDPEHNRDILLAALTVPRDHPLDGLIIIYVGPAEQEAELAEFVRDTGAELRFVPYVPPPADTI